MTNNNLQRKANNSELSDRPTESFFRLAATQSPPTTTLGKVILAQPLPFKLISLLLTAIVIITGIFLANVDYTSALTIQGKLLKLEDSKQLQFIVDVAPATAAFITIDDLASIQFDAYPPDIFSAVSARVISTTPFQQPDIGPQVRLALQLDQEFVTASGSGKKSSLNAGLVGQVKLSLETKSLLAWITPNSLWELTL